MEVRILLHKGVDETNSLVTFRAALEVGGVILTGDGFNF